MKKIGVYLLIILAGYQFTSINAAVPTKMSSTAVLEQIVNSFGSFEQMLYGSISDSTLPIEWGGGIPENLDEVDKQLMTLELRRIQYPEVRIFNTLSVNLRPDKKTGKIISDSELEAAAINCSKINKTRVSEYCLLTEALWPRVAWTLRSFDKFELDKKRIWHVLQTRILTGRKFSQLWNHGLVAKLTKK
jgi:hypothetical protein